MPIFPDHSYGFRADSKASSLCSTRVEPNTPSQPNLYQVGEYAFLSQPRERGGLVSESLSKRTTLPRDCPPPGCAIPQLPPPRLHLTRKHSRVALHSVRIEGVGSLQTSPALDRQDQPRKPLQSTARPAEGYQLLSLPAVFSRLQREPEDLLAFFSAYQLFVSTESLLVSMFELTDSLLAEKAAFLDFLPLFLTTWISFDARLTPHYPKILRFFASPARSQQWPPFSDLSEVLAIGMQTHQTAAVQHSICDNTSIEKNHRSATLFFSLPPAIAAHCLNASHLQVLRLIQPWDLIAYAARPSNDSLCAAAPFHFNALVQWVLTTCLKPEAAKARAQIISTWVQIARCCWELGYISILLMITAALNSTPLSRLKHTWVEVPGDAQRELGAFIQFCSPIGNYGPLREFVYSHKGVVMPVAILTRDIIMLMEMESLSYDVGDGLDLIPYEQCQSLGKLLTLTPVYHLLQEETDQELVPLIQFLSNPVPRFSMEKLYKTSVGLEPIKQIGSRPKSSSWV